MPYKWEKSKIDGVLIVSPHRFSDERGQLNKIFHRSSFEEMGIDCNFDETIVTLNHKKATVRGYHYQEGKYAQAKVLFAANGSFINIVFDVRKDSPTYGMYDVTEINSKTGNMICVPAGIANGYCTLEDNTIVVYNLTNEFSPDNDGGYRYDSVDYKFPFDELIISDKDKSLPKFETLGKRV